MDASSTFTVVCICEAGCFPVISFRYSSRIFGLWIGFPITTTLLYLSNRKVWNLPSAGKWFSSFSLSDWSRQIGLSKLSFFNRYRISFLSSDWKKNRNGTVPWVMESVYWISSFHRCSWSLQLVHPMEFTKTSTLWGDFGRVKSTVSVANRVKTMSFGNRISFPCHSDTKCLISSFFLSWQARRNNNSMIRFKYFMIFCRYILNERIGSLLFTSVARIVPVSSSTLIP